MQTLNILFFSLEEPAPLFKVVSHLPFCTPTHSSAITEEGVNAILNRFNPADLVVVNSHYGVSDMQYLGEITGLESRGILAMRERVEKGRFVPRSLTLVKLIKTFRPNLKVIFVLHKAPRENMRTLLQELGVDYMYNHNEKSAGVTVAVTEFITGVAMLKKNFAADARGIYTAAKKFADAVRP